MEVKIDDIIAAARAGGEIIKRYFGEVLETEEKSSASDFRTKADLEAEAAVLEVLEREFPDVNIFSEETGKKDKGSEYTLVIDPLDGTNNFVIGQPVVSVSIALIKSGVIVAGVVHQPIIGCTFYAEKGKGAYLDGKPIHVNDEANFNRSSVSYTCGYVNDASYSRQLFEELEAKALKRLLVFWSPAYEFCMLASGRIEAIINNKNDLYDYAAGKLILTEAGGKITGFNGQPVDDEFDQFLASNGSALHDEILKLL